MLDFPPSCGSGRRRRRLRQPGKYTAFAPTDEAFAKLTAGVMETLTRPENRAELIALLRMQVVADEAIIAEKANGQQLMARIPLP
ncbi:fasciclin domain-containing protein [Hyphomonas sp.]|uniref:fasciclin domain-containing protein n=1 Tax=Hyphomonas sp. TaxID=87 RepID=UPI003451D057